MGTEIYVWIPNWEKFQHYKKRNPPWIKTYVELLSDEAYLGLSFAQRGLLQGIWLEYARSRCRMSGECLGLSRRMGQQVLRKSLDALSDAGFLELIDSKTLARRLHDARPETETETETETNPPPAPALKPSTNPNGRVEGETINYLIPDQEPWADPEPLTQEDYLAAFKEPT